MPVTLKAARVNAGLTQAEAAERIGVSAATIINWESGNKFPNVKMVEKILQTYNVTYDDVIFLPKDYTESVINDNN